MKQFVSLQLKVIFLLLSLLSLPASVNAETEEIDLSAGVYENKAITWTGTSCSIIQSQGSTSMAVNKSYISAPRWYTYHKVYFRAHYGYQLTSVLITCNTKDYAKSLAESTYSSKVTKKSVDSYSVNITTSGDFEIELTKLVYVSSISVTYTKIDVPTVTTSASSIDFGAAQIGETITKTFNLRASNLTTDLSLSVSGDGASYFDVNPKSISHQDGYVSTTEVSVTFAPESNGSHSALLNICSGDATLANVSLKGKLAAKHHITWIVNDKEYNEGNPTTTVEDGDRVEALPTSPDAIGDNMFVGWTTIAIPTAQAAKPSVLFTTPASAPIVTSDATYYAVYASKGTGTIWIKHPVSDISEGIYAITNADGNAFTGVISSGKGEMTGEAFDFDELNVATSEPQNVCEITVMKSETEGGYVLYNAEYGYLYPKAASTGNLAWHSAENSYWACTEDNKNLKYFANSAYLRIATSSRSLWLNTYSYGYGSAICLVKKESVGSYTTTIDIQPSAEVYEAKDYTFIAHNNAGYWATMSNEKPLFIPTNITASTVVVSNDKLSIDATAFGQPQTIEIDGEQVSGVYIPANTGILLSSADQDAKYYEVSNLSVSSLSAGDNMLKAAPVGGGKFDDDADYMFYKLSYDDYTHQTGLGFYWGADEGRVFNVKANTAYLAVPSGRSNNAKSFLLDGSTTAISSIVTTVTPEQIYNVHGIKVNSATGSGLYIVDGKKIVRK